MSVQLLVYTDYALRVLMYLGARPGETVAASAIAEAYGISGDHVAKAAKALTRQGLLHGARGAGGGVRLAKAPAAIRIGSVVRAFEGERAPVECLRAASEGACPIEPACKLRHALRRAAAAFYRELDGYTLADLVANGPQLVRLLRAG